MQLILVRHGKPESATPERPRNPPLTVLGHRQADLVGLHLLGEHIDRIVSSGMTRAHETAGPLAAAKGMSIDVVEELGEVDRHGAVYASAEMIRAKGEAEWQHFLSNPLGYFGVDRHLFRAEVLRGFSSLFLGREDRTVAVFSHGFPINILLSHALGIDDDARFVPSYASVTRLVGKSIDALTVVSVNETGHLPRGER